MHANHNVGASQQRLVTVPTVRRIKSGAIGVGGTVPHGAIVMSHELCLPPLNCVVCVGCCQVELLWREVGHHNAARITVAAVAEAIYAAPEHRDGSTWQYAPMCTNFIPTANDMLVQFGVERAPFDYKAEAYPGYDAPIVINIMRRVAARDKDRESEAKTKRECIPARFGLIPPNIFAEDVKNFVRKYHTNNARSETVAERRSFRNAWKIQQYCLIPVSCFYEPNWETGKAVRWKIWLKNTKDFAIAGLWEQWKHGEESFHSFSMLTVNADDHAVMRHFHRHGEERRMPVILHPVDYDRWLSATPEEAFRMCQQYPAALMDSEAAPKPGAKAKIELPPEGEAE